MALQLYKFAETIDEQQRITGFIPRHCS